MRIGLVHLSDIHIENENDWIIDKGTKIAQAVSGSWEKFDALFLIITGDVANKGLEEQYKAAHEFFSNIKNYLETELSTKVILIIAPGNHDCDLSGKSIDLKSRDSFIESVLRKSSEIERGDGIYQGCLAVQKNFFNFCRELEKEIEYPIEPEIFYQLKVELKAKKFIFNIYNTAWLSQIKEKQGQLVMPAHLITAGNSEMPNGALSISLFHHPDNWIDATNAIEFRKQTEQNSDIILSGHEHNREIFIKSKPENDSQTQIVRAEALQERGRETTSGFNLIVIDLKNKKQKIFPYKWKETEYANTKESDWIDFVRNRFLQNQSFYLLPDFERYLNTLDSLPQHSRKRDVGIEDFFIAPRLYLTSLQNVIDGKRAGKKIESAKFFSFLNEQKKVIIYGETWQGKTTVAKKVYLDFYDKQIAPLMVDGTKFEKPEQEDFKKVLRTAFAFQYSQDLWERFLQLPKTKRALVIDNFGTSLNQQSLQKLLEIASDLFDSVVVFAHDNLRLQQHLQNETGEVKFSTYAHCKMLQFDPSQRTQIIRRWVRLEADLNIQEAELVRQENQLRGMILTAVNSGLISSTPFFILGVLQLIESYKSNPNAQFGSIGYIYEGIITNRLSELGKTPQHISQMFLIASLIAHNLYKNNRSEIDEEDIIEVIKKYNIDYRQDIYPANFLKDLQNSRIMVKLANANWRFTGSHLRDFFVAKYYALAVNEDEYSEQKQAISDIQLMIETIIYEPHTRILLFLVYEANNNTSLIRKILSEATYVFSECEVANFTTDVQFLNDLEQSILNCNLLESENPLKNRDDYEANGEDDDDGETEIDAPPANQMVRYSQHLDEFTKAAIALKMMELVGQLVKSFATTIKAELKHQLIEECVNVGLRFLRSVLELHKTNLAELSELLKKLIRQRHPKLNEKELENRIDELLVFVHHNLAYAVIKRISYSVGTEDLKGSFSDVFGASDLLSYEIVETAIRLDHYQILQADKLTNLKKKVKDNDYARNVLRRLVADYVNYFEVRGPERQKLVSAFELSDKKDYLLNEAKSDRSIHLKTNEPPKPLPSKRR